LAKNSRDWQKTAGIGKKQLGLAKNSREWQDIAGIGKITNSRDWQKTYSRDWQKRNYLETITVKTGN